VDAAANPGAPQRPHRLVPRDALGPLHTVTTALRIERRRSRATLLRDGRVVWRSAIGHGAPGMATPSGHFYIRERLDKRGGDPVYGPWAFGTSAYSALSDWPGGGVIGIHGTNQPWLIPGRPSHGCIRVPNPAIRRLAPLMPVGTPVRIR
jgi:lipoprotein-anchoring transpeptidase ErfK/SrfK